MAYFDSCSNIDLNNKYSCSVLFCPNQFDRLIWDEFIQLYFIFKIKYNFSKSQLPSWIGVCRSYNIHIRKIFLPPTKFSKLKYPLQYFMMFSRKQIHFHFHHHYWMGTTYVSISIFSIWSCTVTFIFCMTNASNWEQTSLVFGQLIHEGEGMMNIDNSTENSKANKLHLKKNPFPSLSRM